MKSLKHPKYTETRAILAQFEKDRSTQKYVLPQGCFIPWRYHSPNTKGDGYFFVELDPATVVAMNIDGNTVLYWGIDITEGCCYITVTEESFSQYSVRPLVFVDGRRIVKIPDDFARLVRLEEDTVWKVELNLAKKRIDVRPYPLESPYIITRKHTTIAYRGPPPVTSVVEIRHNSKR